MKRHFLNNRTCWKLLVWSAGKRANLSFQQGIVHIVFIAISSFFLSPPKKNLFSEVCFFSYHAIYLQTLRDRRTFLKLVVWSTGKCTSRPFQEGIVYNRNLCLFIIYSIFKTKTCFISKCLLKSQCFGHTMPYIFPLYEIREHV